MFCRSAIGRFFAVLTLTIVLPIAVSTCQSQTYNTSFNRHVFTTGNAVSFSLQNTHGIAGDVRLLSYGSKSVQTIHVKANENKTVSLGSNLQTGVYWLTNPDGTILDTFGVLPNPSRKTSPENSPFGVFYAYTDNPSTGWNNVYNMLDSLTMAGIPWVRATTMVTPTNDAATSFDWSARDNFVNAINQHGMLLLSVFEPIDFPTTWTTNGSARLWQNPKTLAAVQDYVTHYRGKLKYFEVWNEANGVQLDSQYEAFARVFYATTKAANAGAVVVQTGLASPQYSGQWGAELGPTAQSKYLSAGLKSCTDVYNFHFYPYQWRTRTIVNQYMNVYKTYGVSKPVWVTENGEDYDPTGISAQQAAAQYLVQSAVTCFGSGVNKYFWFLAADHPLSHGVLNVAENCRPRAVFVAYGVLTKMLDNVDISNSAHINSTTTDGYIFKAAAGAEEVAVAWAKSSTVQIDPRTLLGTTTPVAVYDIMGCAVPLTNGLLSLSQTPVYITPVSSGVRAGRHRQETAQWAGS